MATSSYASDHNNVSRGKCTKCTCLMYHLKEGTNTCAGCTHPSTLHEIKNGCVGAFGCACKEYVHVPNVADCYTCGHVPSEHIGLGRRTALSAEMGEKQPDAEGSQVNRPKTFSEMKESNKRKRQEAINKVAGKTLRNRQLSAKFRRTIKVQLKRPKFSGGRGKKLIYSSDGDQRQLSFNTTTTIENVLKACAKEYLNISEVDYTEEVAKQGLDLFLMDGKAVVKDPVFTFNKTSFNFVYLKRKRLSPSLCIADLYVKTLTSPSAEVKGLKKVLLLHVCGRAKPIRESKASGEENRYSQKHLLHYKIEHLYASVSSSSSESSVVVSLGKVQEFGKVSEDASGAQSSTESSMETQGCSSLSRDDVLNCGKSILPATPSALGEIFQISTFCVDSKSWVSLGYIRLDIEEEEFDRGGMRVARKATIVEAASCNHPLLQKFSIGIEILIKQYTDAVLEAVEESDRTILSIAKKEIQTQMVCYSLAKQFAQIHKERLSAFPEVIPCFLAIADFTEEVYMIEEMLSGTFVKYMGNDGKAPSKSRGAAGDTCLALAHWSLLFGNGEFLVTDLQGTGFKLTDVELATKEKGYYGIGNVGHEAIENFKMTHKCNSVCKRLNLAAVAFDDETTEKPPSKSTFVV